MNKEIVSNKDFACGRAKVMACNIAKCVCILCALFFAEIGGRLDSQFPVKNKKLPMSLPKLS